ncbi:DUF6520 family protein [Mucilaginibacter ginsenosidivorax]|uniref:Uncharacterized protein n=1 Tax=Mucilaginibacter ginsenosidivorax TaxID=862126 RepID=A0A5B8VTV0_9SPHI|nr:DUF6520 family protein [Mucilaginibacter ginsenosidivorax]QEC74673.1 hypothetical protein FSB76_01440 [Mucilaginibacter ginsenosidivorax]
MPCTLPTTRLPNHRPHLDNAKRGNAENPQNRVGTITQLKFFVRFLAKTAVSTMKSIKGSMIALAFVLGIGGAFATNAHHAAHKPAKTTDVWWQFNGTQAQISDGTKYTQVAGEPAGCSGSNNRCAILAPANPLHTNQPDLSAIDQEDLKN